MTVDTYTFSLGLKITHYGGQTQPISPLSMRTRKSQLVIILCLK